MAKTYNKMQIDMNGDILSTVTAVAKDTLSRYLDCNLYNNGVPLDLTGHMAQLYVTKPDETIVVTQGEITDVAAGRVQFELTNQTLAVTGWLSLQIVLTSGEGEVLSSEIFKLHVLPSIRSDEAIESTNEFGALVVLFQEIQNSLDLMNAIIESFGEPGEVAEEYGATTFWGIMEASLKNVDFAGVLKSFVNTTVGTDYFMPINKMISDVSGTDRFVPLNILLGNLMGGKITFVTNGIWTVPEGITKVLITACGAGGGGGGGAIGTSVEGTQAGGGGGGGACINKQAFNVTPGDEIIITIGVGGKGGSGGTNATVSENGGAGGPTIIGNLVTLPGGIGGASAANGGSGGTSGGPGGGDGGASGNVSGSDGVNGLVGAGGAGGGNATYNIGGAGGGGGSFRDGGDGGTNQSGFYTGVKEEIGEDGEYGGGGGGGAWPRINATSGNGGRGGNGIVIIEWGL